MRLRQLCAVAAMGAFLPSLHAQEVLYVDAASRGHDINPSMYGIFFEEINHSGDGGLYAELLQNRGFEEQTIPGGFHENGYNRIQSDVFTRYLELTTMQLNWDWNYAAKKMTGWKVDSKGCSLSYDVELPPVPLHSATPNAMRLTIANSAADATARLINTGYWGIAVEKDAKYDLRFYLNTSDYAGKVKAVIYDADTKEVLAETAFDVDRSGAWKEYKAVMTPGRTIKDGNFALVFSGNGTVYADHVSLFPQDTFCNRPNGLRPDIAQALVDLKPKFMRWPGGCIVEGILLENRVKWKETLGDPMTRPGEYDQWGYRASWGMGYHEILQFCEDAGMDCMFVGNAGMACIGWSGQHVTGDDVEPYYQDIRDAIEYAIGDPATNEWAARRAEAGHPKPFPLKYVEIGNENFSARYDANYKYIYNKLKAEYPQLTFLNTMGIEHAEEFNVRTDMIDPHWYVAPEFFYNNRRIFDKTPRGHYEIYVGEYATNAYVGQGNMDAALSEAVFMMSMERNSDLVKMASYAPLITNDHAPNWSCNLIWQHSGEVLGRASYYTQKLFAENLPTYNVASSLHSDFVPVAYNGRVGIGTWSTAADFRNFKVSAPDGTVLYTADFPGARGQWTDMQGSWSASSDGLMSQSDNAKIRCITLMNQLSFRDCVIEVEARKNSGAEGFLLTFGCNDSDWDHYYQFNVGGWGNTRAGIEDVTNGGGAIISEHPSFRIDNGKWYKLRLVCHNGKVEGYIDGELYCSHDFSTDEKGRIAAHAGYDAEAGEIVVKVVNGEDRPMPLTLAVNAVGIAPEAIAETMKAASLWDENSFSTPTLIAPEKKTIGGVSDRLAYTFEPYSLTVIRIKGTPATDVMEIPARTYSSVPRELAPETESRATAALKRMIDEAYAVMFADVEGCDNLRKAVDDASAALRTADEAVVAASVPVLEGALKDYYRAIMATSAEMTERVANAHFEKSGDNSGWSGNPVVDEHVAEKFNTGFSISQTVEGLDKGYYLAYVQGYYRNGPHVEARERNANGTEELLASFGLNDMSKPVVSLMSEKHAGYWLEAPNNMREAHAVFAKSPENFANFLIAHVGDDGNLRISFTKSKIAETDWFCFDNVRLFRVDTAELGVVDASEVVTEFSPSAEIYDLHGHRVGSYAGIGRLARGIYVIAENGRSAKFRR